MSPLYDYLCGNCGNEFEVLLSLKEYVNVGYPCPECGRSSFIIITRPILTCLPANKRLWGTSRYRSHDRGEKTGKKKEGG